MTAILYEHPLNERIRNYLKLEQLFAQASDCLNYNMTTSHSVFFNALFAILDTLEKEKGNLTLKGDLIKNTFITSSMGVSYKVKLGKAI